MIDEIRLHNVALIDEASMVPARGLTVLTGETGSGKTAFLSGIKLLVGERSSADMVRDGQDSLLVECRFFDASDESGEGTVVSRSVTADGRTRVRINGAMASVRDLATTVGQTVDLCGQHEHQRLARTANQGQMLDAWIGGALQEPLSVYRTALLQARRAHERLDHLQKLGAADDARLDEARFVMRRMDEVDPRAGEYEQLLDEAKRMENLEDLVNATTGAREALSGEAGAIDALNQAISFLKMGASYDTRLGMQMEALQHAGYLLEDASRDIDALVPDTDSLDGARLEEVQARIAAYQALMRSYGPTVEEVLRQRDEARAALAEVDDREALLAAAERRLREAERSLAQAAESLSACRRQAAPQFETEVNALLEQLEMPGCSLQCRIERLERERFTENGPDAIEFLFSPGRDIEPRSLNRIASGGEMSRVVLAVKAVLGNADEVETLVFDEVDAGVGGKTALAVGEVLRRLSKTHQVIVVTHLPQIAVLGDAHYVVSREGDDAPVTSLCEVSGSRRTREIARMLSGKVDNTSLVHAEALLRVSRG